MKITDVISDSMLDGSFFGLPKQTATFIAMPAHQWETNNKTIRCAPQVFRVERGGRHHPYSFSIDDILNLDWETKNSMGAMLNEEELYHGITEVDEDSMKLLTELFEVEGYGIIDSFQEINGGSGYRMWMRSSLFDKTECGSATPLYIFEYTEDTRTLKASRI